jgi:hypothetical protein
VRDTGGEPSDRFHLLRLAQPLLELLSLCLRVLPLRDIAEIYHQGLHAGFMQQIAHRALDRTPRPVFVQQHHLIDDYCIWLREQPCDCICHVLTVVRMDGAIQRSPGELIRPIAEHLFNRCTGVGDALLWGAQHDPLGAFLDHCPKTLLTLLQRLLRLLVFGHIHHRSNKLEVARLVCQGTSHHL